MQLETQALRGYQKAKKLNDSKELKQTAKELANIRQSFGLSEYQLHAYIKKHQHNYKKHIDSSSHLVQRDLYSAFLLMNSEPNLQQVNQDLCKKTFTTFIELHNQHIEDLKQVKKKFPLSMGIQQIK